MRRRVQALDRESRGPEAARGFTLLEILVVIVIILVVSIVALPTIFSAFGARQQGEAARILLGAIVGARDKAIHDGEASGIRLLPDPTFAPQWPSGSSAIDSSLPLAYNRIIPIGPAPEYGEGLVSIYPTSGVNGVDYTSITGITPFLVLEQSVVDGRGFANAPTDWYWNVRVGDKIQINNAGAWYTVVGPARNGPSGGNTEYFVNWGAPGSPPPWSRGGNPVEVLLLVNGRDDNGDGWVDQSWDGVDNDGSGAADDFGTRNGVAFAEWLPYSITVTNNGQTQTLNYPGEIETWLGAASGPTGIFNVPYTIQRRPAPTAGSREIALPTAMVIDATTWGNAAKERSRLPVNQYNGTVEIMVNPDGTVFYSLPYGVPSSIGMDQTFYHFWLAERQDVSGPSASATASPYLLLPAGVGGAANMTGPGTIQGHYSLLTLFARTGRTVVSHEPPFLYDSSLGYNSQSGTYNASNPFIPAEQGVEGGP